MVARVNWKSPGLLFVVGISILAGHVGLGIGSSSAEPLAASIDRQQQDAPANRR